MTLNYGRCIVNSDFNVAFEDSDLDVIFDNSISHFPGDTTVGWSFGETVRKFKLVDIRFKTTVDAELFLNKIQALQDAGIAFKIEWQIHSTGTDFKFDGTATSMLCLCNKIGKLRKSAKGDDGIYHVSICEFEEASKS